jgi:hypothetical protein
MDDTQGMVMKRLFFFASFAPRAAENGRCFIIFSLPSGESNPEEVK